MLLRKYISQGIITGISQIGFDRILKFAILGHNELGDPIEYDLYAELMGKYANLVLVDHHSSTIIDCLKRIPVFENSKRLLHPGAKYTLPAPQQKMSPLSVDGLDLESSLVKQVEGFSPLYQRNICTGFIMANLLKKSLLSFSVLIIFTFMKKSFI